MTAQFSFFEKVNILQLCRNVARESDKVKYWVSNSFLKARIRKFDKALIERRLIITRRYQQCYKYRTAP